MAVTERLFRQGNEYTKAGVLLPYLEPASSAPRSLFDRPDPRSERLMMAVDAVSTAWGKGAVRLASQGVQVGKGWEMT